MKINSNDNCYASDTFNNCVLGVSTRRKTKSGYKHDGDTDV